jgi:LysR family transcriptional regulator for metE and metH
MIPTPAGEQLSAIARDVLRALSAFERQVYSGEYDKSRGSLTLATECYTVYHWLPAVLKIFLERWPAVDLRIAPEFTSSPFAALRDGALDMAIVHTPSTDKRIRTDVLFDDEMVVVTSPRHRFARQSSVQLEQFADEHLIIYSTANGTVQVLSDLLSPAGVIPERITRIQLTEAILDLLAADLGVAILSRWAVVPWIKAGTLIATRLTERGFRRQWYIACRADQPTTAHALHLVELLRSHVGGGGPVVFDAQRSA